MRVDFDITLLTDHRWLNPPKPNLYARNVLLEDRLVAEALARQGLRVQRVDWGDQSVDWSLTATALFRTTWDYFHRFEEFQVWLSKTASLTQLINPVEIIRWNCDKHYLGELQERGIHIPPTKFIEAGDPRTLAELHGQHGWPEWILKPCVSGGAKNTFRLQGQHLAEHEATYRQLIEREAFLIQPLLTSVLEAGELSLMVIGGEVTHAVRKVAKPGDFRVQDDWGGTVYPHEPSVEEVTFAEKAVAACDPMPVYARVDMVRDGDGQWAIMELELIEPEMWFRMNPSAADRFAQIIARRWFSATHSTSEPQSM